VSGDEKKISWRTYPSITMKKEKEGGGGRKGWRLNTLLRKREKGKERGGRGIELPGLKSSVEAPP